MYLSVWLTFLVAFVGLSQSFALFFVVFDILKHLVSIHLLETTSRQK